MADILIRGMEMPKTCADCHDADLPTAIAFLGTKCPRATGCPIHELPEHGDLIDKYRIPYRDTYGGLIAEKDVIDRLPVIVPSNKEGVE